MTDRMQDADLRHIDPRRIFKNPENPRLVFRPDEMATLLQSIKEYGIQVPITVYRDKERFYLIDGERRWRCAIKLNLKAVPAIIQEKPSALENLLLMFNIHALREQWDYLTIALKLPRIIELFRKENKREPKEDELSNITGLRPGQIRRCRFLLDLPKRYLEMLLDELEKPKPTQKLSEDFFIEMERAFKTVHARVPEAVDDLNQARDAMIKKYKAGIIENVTDFRKVSKIATAVKRLGIAQKRARAALEAIFDPDSTVKISEIYADVVEIRAEAARALSNIDYLIHFVDDAAAREAGEIPDEVISAFKKLYKRIRAFLGEGS